MRARCQRLSNQRSVQLLTELQVSALTGAFKIKPRYRDLFLRITQITCRQVFRLLPWQDRPRFDSGETLPVCRECRLNPGPVVYPGLDLLLRVVFSLSKRRIGSLRFENLSLLNFPENSHFRESSRPANLHFHGLIYRLRCCTNHCKWESCSLSRQPA